MHKPELKLKSIGILASAVLVLGSIGFSGAAVASTNATQLQGSSASSASSEVSERSGYKKQRRGDAKRGHHRHHRMENAALLVPGYGPVPQDVVDSLSLSAEQTSLLDDAKSFIAEHRKAKREQFKTKGQAGDRTITAPLDPSAALKRQDERFSAMQEVRTEGAQKWLAVWDSLDSEQQQTVSDYMVKRSQERAKRAADHREKREARKANKS